MGHSSSINFGSFNMMKICLLSLSALFLASLSSSTLEGDFCSDISFWDVVEYKSRDARCCEVGVKRSCEKKSKEVCLEATELECKAIAWAECRVSVWEKNGVKKCEPTYKDFQYKDCQEENYSVKHKKKLPECKEVTKDNCVTNWNIDNNGNKVWSGEEECSPVTWEECNIVEKEVDFPAVRTKCDTVGTIKWVDYVQQNDATVEELQNRCEVHSAVHCEPATRNACTTVYYTECTVEKTQEECKNFVVHEPFQQKRHQKKCLAN